MHIWNALQSPMLKASSSQWLYLEVMEHLPVGQPGEIPLFIRIMSWKRALRHCPFFPRFQTQSEPFCSLLWWAVALHRLKPVRQSKCFLVFRIYYHFKLCIEVSIIECRYPQRSDCHEPEWQLRATWHGYWGLNLGPLQEQYTLLTTEWPLQHQSVLFIDWFSHAFSVIIKAN